MKEETTTDLVPQCPIDAEAYERLYAFNHGTDDYLEDDTPWQQVRIRPSLSEQQSYRLLPSAAGYEYGGYVTKSRIRYCKCHLTRAFVLSSKACTFHSHPTGIETADLPSSSDVFQFLNFRHLRTVIVGSTRIIVWDKTKATIGTIRRLGAWADAHMLSEIRLLEKEFPQAWQEPYMKLALKNLGLEWPSKLRDLKEDWEGMLRKVLRIKVRIFPREPGVNSR